MSKKSKKKQKATVHPSFGKIKVVMTDGTEFETFSTLAGQMDTLTLDVDPTTHAAWTKQKTNVNARSSKVKKFSDQFGDLKL